MTGPVPYRPVPHDELLTAAQAAYADGLDLVEVYVTARATGRLDTDRSRHITHGLTQHNRVGAQMLVSFWAGLLGSCAFELAYLTGKEPADIVASWRQLAAAAINRGEQGLAGEFGDGGEPA